MYYSCEGLDCVHVTLSERGNRCAFAGAQLLSLLSENRCVPRWQPIVSLNVKIFVIGFSDATIIYKAHLARRHSQSVAVRMSLQLVPSL